jgi:hypothetical protein
MKNVAYYHVYLDDLCTWAQIFAEQMNYMEESNLLQNLDVIRVTAITQADERLEIFKSFCALYPVDFEIEFIKNIHPNDHEMMQSWSSIFDKMPATSETYTLSKIWNQSKEEDFNILYFHMKGITATLNNLVVPGRISKYRNRYNWRQFLNWGVLTEWRQCVDHLKDNDVVGVDFQDQPSKHFRGNFFWTKSSHVRTLPDPAPIEWWEECKKKMNDEWMNKASDRFRDEQWICYKDDIKIYNVSPNEGHYNANDI